MPLGLVDIPHLNSTFLSKRFIWLSLDLQAPICLSSCPFYLNSQAMVNASPTLVPSLLLPAVGPCLPATFLFVKHFAFKADFKPDGSHSKRFIPLLIKARATVELD